jgi:hypothetical protein
MPRVKRRSKLPPLFGNKPTGLLVSDNDWMEENADACIWFLENAAAIRRRLFPQSPKSTK